MERLQKVIAASGICSRREAERLIEEGKVKVNGRFVRELGTQVSEEDVIEVQGRPLPKVSGFVVYAVNKPRGVITSLARQGKAPIITDLVPSFPKVLPVGRLDKDSEGLILLTNNGALLHALTHPSFEHEKSYRVWCRREKGNARPLEQILRNLEKGVKLGDGEAKTDKATGKEYEESIVLHLDVHEGRHHLIRRLCATQGLEVRRLQRLRIGTIQLDTIKPGSYRQLKDSEIARLRDSK